VKTKSRPAPPLRSCYYCRASLALAIVRFVAITPDGQVDACRDCLPRVLRSLEEADQEARSILEDLWEQTGS